MARSGLSTRTENWTRPRAPKNAMRRARQPSRRMVPPRSCRTIKDDSDRIKSYRGVAACRAGVFAWAILAN
jgi:hypothetical protein